MAQRYTFVDLKPPAHDFLADVLAGLSRQPKQIPCKYFYDSRGSWLFERICELPEYYLTRTEVALLRGHGPAMAAALGEDSVLIEYGSGSARKTRLMLEAASPVAYVPIDISHEQLARVADDLARAFPRLRVVAVCADYTLPLAIPGLEDLSGRRRAVFFPGSTIGNFTSQESLRFLQGMRAVVGEDGRALIGVDLKKDKAVLDAAYDDAEGVTAQFNLNLLARINRELGADFDLDAFQHRAFYDPGEGRVEMHLVSRTDQRVRIRESVFEFRAGETIHTENSYKYSIPEFEAVAKRAGWRVSRTWTDPAQLFSVHCLAV